MVGLVPQVRILARSEFDHCDRTQANMLERNTRYITLKRTISLIAVLATTFSAQAMAGEPASAHSKAAQNVATHSAELSVAANAEQVRKLLQSQGYTNVSELSRDSNGRWTGTATKNGEIKLVAVALPKNAAAPSTTN